MEETERIRAILEETFGAVGSINIDEDEDLDGEETVTASTELVVTITFAQDIDVWLTRAYVDHRDSTTFYWVVNGKQKNTNDYEPARPLKLTTRTVVLKLTNAALASQIYGYFLRGWYRQKGATDA